MGNCFATESNATITVTSIDRVNNKGMVSSSRDKKLKTSSKS